VSLLASLLSLALVLPLLFFGPTYEPSVGTMSECSERSLTSIPQKTFSPDDRSVNAGMAALSAIVLVLAVPPLVITTPSAPLPHALKPHALPLSRTLALTLVLALSLAPAGLARALSDCTLVLALAGNYLVPAFLHAALHQFKRPLSILVPGRGLARARDEDDERAPLAGVDELLVRKERTLQRKRWVRRVAWDVAVWTMLLPVGGGGIVWAAGRLAGRW
jgi:hypothetical protein